MHILYLCTHVCAHTTTSKIAVWLQSEGTQAVASFDEPNDGNSARKHAPHCSSSLAEAHRLQACAESGCSTRELSACSDVALIAESSASRQQMKSTIPSPSLLAGWLGRLNAHHLLKCRDRPALGSNVLLVQRVECPTRCTAVCLTTSPQWL
jgi:hypothetical protein